MDLFVILFFSLFVSKRDIYMKQLCETGQHKCAANNLENKNYT